MLVYLAVLALLRPKMTKLAVALLSTVTIFELGYNAYLSQVTFGYADVDKFTDAAVSVKRVTDSVQENADQPFYRIATTFAYSRTFPSLVGYPGLSTFSSSLERTTMDQFAYMGDIGINAATEYENGTPLTDALYGIRYYMDVKDVDKQEKDAHPGLWMVWRKMPLSMFVSSMSSIWKFVKNPFETYSKIVVFKILPLKWMQT